MTKKNGITGASHDELKFYLNVSCRTLLFKETAWPPATYGSVPIVIVSEDPMEVTPLNLVLGLRVLGY